jgi:hypothetical protein
LKPRNHDKLELSYKDSILPYFEINFHNDLEPNLKEYFNKNKISEKILYGSITKISEIRV